MKKNLLISARLSLVFLVICSVLYPLLVAGLGKWMPGGGNGVAVKANGRTVGYELIGQKFTRPEYFWGRPSAVDYNASGSAGSNKGPSNPEYLKTVEGRIDSFLVHNPGVRRNEIPAEMVTASGSGLDPDISPASAYIQVKRVAAARNLPEEKVKSLVDAHVRKTGWGLFGPDIVNVLKLNVDLDALK